MGSFIVFEGCEGVGKSTQLRFIKEYVEKTNQKVLFTREPGGTPLAEEIRNIILTKDMYPETEAALFAAARVDHINNFLKPKLDEGYTIICDRYIDSSLAYQGIARGLGFDRVKEINKYALENMMPDCVILLDLDPKDAWRRKNGVVVENDRIDNESLEFHTLVYKGYQMLAKEEKRFVLIKPEQEKLDTHRKIIEALKERKLLN